MEADIIISSHGSGLTFSLFCNNNTIIIEILNKGTSGFPCNHILNICNIIKIPYYRYTNIKEDRNGNFNLNFNEFDPFLINK
jgi:capsular polysaccharide biosynthesis protein